MLWSISNKCCHIHLYQQRTGLWNSKEGHYLLRQMSKKWRHTSLWTLGTQKVLLVIFLMHLIQACKMIFFSFPKMLNWKAKKKKTTKNWQKKKKEHLLVQGEKFNNHCFCQNAHVLRRDSFYRSSELESVEV